MDIPHKLMGMAKYVEATTEEIIKHLTKRAGHLKDSELAELLDTQRQHVYLWKKGKSVPGPDNLAKLGLTPMFRIDNDEPFTPPEPKKRDERASIERQIENLKKKLENISPPPTQKPKPKR